MQQVFEVHRMTFKLSGPCKKEGDLNDCLFEYQIDVFPGLNSEAVHNKTSDILCCVGICMQQVSVVHRGAINPGILH